MINDTSQRSVAMWFRCGVTFAHYFIRNLLLSLFWKNFWNSLTFGKTMEQSWLPQAPCAPGHCTAESSLKKSMITYWRMAGRNCCNSITFRWIGLLLTNIDSVIGKYQTGVMSTNCAARSPTDAISDWTLTVCTGIFTTSFFKVHRCA